MSTNAKSLLILAALALLSAGAAYAAARLTRRQDDAETEADTDSNPLDLSALSAAKASASAAPSITTPTTMKYFTMTELSRSDKARSLGLDNTPGAAQRLNLEALAQNVLDPAREAYGAPVYVTSGYRSPEVNKAVGGVATSQHIKGEAADLSTGDAANNMRLGDIIRQQNRFDQLIYERCSAGGCRWLHVSYKRSGTNRHQVIYN